jgi:putative oxidoreductase
VVFPHGVQKVFGWFGGHGFKGTMQYFVKSGIPAPLARPRDHGRVPRSDRPGPWLLTWLAALGVAAVMLVAILTVHREHGFFMNWFGNQRGEGFEYHLLARGLAIALMIGGGGAWSLDALIASAKSTAADRSPLATG